MIKKEREERIKKLGLEIDDLGYDYLETFHMKNNTEASKKRLELGRQKHIKLNELKSLYKEKEKL